MDPALLADWISLHLLPGLGPVAARAALQRYQDPGAVAYRIPPSDLAGFGRVDADAIASGRRDLRRRAERELDLCDKHAVRIVACVDSEYPAALAEVESAPLLLYLRGAVPEGVVRLAVVGSRTPTHYGRRIATGLGSGFAARGIEVVSGGARGIDACAHRGALAVVDGRTLAVLGSGLLRPYPAEHRELFEEISARGALVTEFALEEPPRPENFPRRNRLISGLAAGVVVVEAAERSGTLSTAAHALEQGREVLAVPGPVDSLKSVGCHRLIQQGAKLVQGLDDVLAELSPMYLERVRARREPARVAAEPADWTADEAAVLAVLASAGTAHVDRLAEEVPFGISRLQSALFGLELRGAVEQTPGRYYVLAPQKEA